LSAGVAKSVKPNIRVIDKIHLDKIPLLEYLLGMFKIGFAHKYLHNKINKELTMGDVFKIIGDLGMPVAVALAGGYFVYLTIKLLLQGVLGSIKGMAGIITALDNRVKTMNHDVIRIDTIVSNALGLRPDVDRISRADGKNDARRD
jgi:hypothetical protein